MATEYATMKKHRVLVVDDEEINLKILRIYLEDKGYEVISTLNGEEAINILKAQDVSVCICDIRMPKVSGIDVLNYVQQNCPIVPVIMLTGFIEINTAVSVMRQGATNYITKPIDAGELIIAVEKAIEHRRLLEDKKRLEEENMEYRRELERKVEQKGYQLESSKLDMVVALNNTLEEREPRIIAHCRRVSQYANILGRQIEIDRSQLNLLNYSSALHDIGLIGMPDSILKKRQALSEEELKIWRGHVETGVRIIEPVSFLEDAVPVIRYHHEYYDGSGYPEGLSGEKIPLFARIVGLVNAFDNLTSSIHVIEKPSVEEAVKYIEKYKGVLFDPALVDAFLIVVQKIVARFPQKNQA